MHTEPTLERNPVTAQRERASGLEGYCNYKVWMESIPEAYVFSVTAKTAQEACEIYLEKIKPQEDCKVNVQNSLLPNGRILFSVKCVPTITYSLSLES